MPVLEPDGGWTAPHSRTNRPATDLRAAGDTGPVGRHAADSGLAVAGEDVVEAVFVDGAAGKEIQLRGRHDG